MARIAHGLINWPEKQYNVTALFCLKKGQIVLDCDIRKPLILSVKSYSVLIKNKCALNPDDWLFNYVIDFQLFDIYGVVLIGSRNSLKKERFATSRTLCCRYTCSVFFVLALRHYY